MSLLVFHLNPGYFRAYGAHSWSWSTSSGKRCEESAPKIIWKVSSPYCVRCVEKMGKSTHVIGMSTTSRSLVSGSSCGDLTLSTEWKQTLDIHPFGVDSEVNLVTRGATEWALNPTSAIDTVEPVS